MTTQTETIMTSAFARAGMDTAACRLRQLANEALDKHHMNADRALTTFLRRVDGDNKLIREALRFYLQEQSLLRNGRSQLGAQNPNAEAQQSPSRDGSDLSPYATPRDFVRPSREPTVAQKAATASIAKAAALTVLDKRKTSDGRPWGNVGAHELDGMAHDGTMAAALKGDLGALSNKQRFMTLRELITPERFEVIWQLARAGRDD